MKKKKMKKEKRLYPTDEQTFELKKDIQRAMFRHIKHAFDKGDEDILTLAILRAISLGNTMKQAATKAFAEENKGKETGIYFVETDIVAAACLAGAVSHIDDPDDVHPDCISSIAFIGYAQAMICLNAISTIVCAADEVGNFFGSHHASEVLSIMKKVKGEQDE